MNDNHYNDDLVPFRIKAYGLQELGQMYFPTSTPRSASAMLKKMDQAESRTTRQPDEGRLFQRAKDIDTETSPDHRGIPGPAIKKPDSFITTTFLFWLPS